MLYAYAYALEPRPFVCDVVDDDDDDDDDDDVAVAAAVAAAGPAGGSDAAIADTVSATVGDCWSSSPGAAESCGAASAAAAAGAAAWLGAPDAPFLLARLPCALFDFPAVDGSAVPFAMRDASNSSEYKHNRIKFDDIIPK